MQDNCSVSPFIVLEEECALWGNSGWAVENPHNELASGRWRNWTYSPVTFLKGAKQRVRDASA